MHLGVQLAILVDKRLWMGDRFLSKELRFVFQIKGVLLGSLVKQQLDSQRNLLSIN